MPHETATAPPAKPLYQLGDHVIVAGFLDGSAEQMRRYADERDGKWTVLPAYLSVAIVLGYGDRDRVVPKLVSPEGQLDIRSGPNDAFAGCVVDGNTVLSTLRRPNTSTNRRERVTTWVLANITLDTYSDLVKGNYMPRPGEGYQFRHRTDGILREIVAGVLLVKGGLP